MINDMLLPAASHCRTASCRHAGTRRRHIAHIALCAAFLVLNYGATIRGYAEEVRKFEDLPLDELQKTLESKDFGEEKKSWNIVPREKQEETNPVTKESPLLDKILSYISSYALLIIALGLALALIAIIIINRKSILQALALLSKKRSGGKFNITTDNIQDEDENTLLERSLRFYKEEKYTEAYSCCYKAAIHILKKYFIVPGSGATEYECLSLVQNSDLDTDKKSSLCENFEIVVRCRIKSAYSRASSAIAGDFYKALNACKSLA